MPTLKKKKKSQISRLTSHFKELEKEEQTKPKATRKKEIINIRVQISKIETRKTTESMKQKAFFKKINKINKPLD